jgi:hypothetical protein
MPRTNVPVTSTSRTKFLLGASGTEVSGDSANNHDFANDGKTLLLLRNSGVTTRVCTVITQPTVDGEAVADKSVSLLNGEHAVVGPFPPNVYDSAGRVQVDVPHAEVKLQAISLGT